MNQHTHILSAFPDRVEQFHYLNATDPLFGKLADSYQRVEREMDLARTDAEGRSDLEIGELRRERSRLKDQIERRLHEELP